MKKYMIFVMAMCVLPNYVFGYSARYNSLVAEKQRKMEELEKCSGNVNGWKIAGISTLGLTAVGVAGNVVLSNKNNEYQDKIDNADRQIEKAQAELDKINADKAAKDAKAKEEANQKQEEQKKQEDAKIIQCKEKIATSGSVMSNLGSRFKEYGSCKGTVVLNMDPNGKIWYYPLTKEEAVSISSVWNWVCDAETGTRYTSSDTIEDHERNACEDLASLEGFRNTHSSCQSPRKNLDLKEGGIWCVPADWTVLDENANQEQDKCDKSGGTMNDGKCDCSSAGTNKVSENGECVQKCQQGDEKVAVGTIRTLQDKSQAKCGADGEWAPIVNQDNKVNNGKDNNQTKQASNTSATATPSTKKPAAPLTQKRDTFFNDTNVKLSQGKKLVGLYAQKNNWGSLKCEDKYKTVKGDDELICTGDGVKYTFVFDDLNERYEGTANKSIAETICRIMGGQKKTETDTGIRKEIRCEGVSCNSDGFQKAVQSFGFTAKINSVYNTSNVGGYHKTLAYTYCAIAW